MSMSYAIQKQVTVGNKQFAATRTLVGNFGIIMEETIGPAQPGFLITRTSNTAGVLSMTNANHGIVGTDLLDTYWAASGVVEVAHQATVSAVSGQQVTFSGAAGTNLPAVISAPAAGPTLAAGAAGNPSGAYKYVVTFVTGANGINGGETTASPETTITVTNQQVNLTAIPLGPTGTVARKIYRTAAGGGTGTEKLVATISDNTTTTFTDNVADGSLGATVPGSNTAVYAAITAMVPVACPFPITGDNLQGLVCYTDSPGVLNFTDATHTSKLAVEIITAADTYEWSVGDVASNPLAGLTCTQVLISHNNATAAQTMRAAIISN